MRVALVGLGVMGSRMAPHFARVADLGVYDLDPARTAETAGDGVRALDDLAAVADHDVVILMLPNSDAVEAVIGDDADPDALAARLRPGTVVVDMGSSVPSRTARLAERLAARGVALVDAPVSGGPRKAATGELTVMAGGTDEAVATVRPVLDAVAASVTHTGQVGSAHALKSLNNLLSAIGLVGALEVVTIGAKFGLDPHLMLDVINRSTGRNQSTEVKLESAVLAGNYDVGFSLALCVKDIATAIELGGELGVPSPLSRLTVDVCRDALEFLGGGHPDQSEIAKYLAARSGVSLTDG